MPDPGPGEVRVRITRSAINPTDWKTRAGLTGADPRTSRSRTRTARASSTRWRRT